MYSPIYKIRTVSRLVRRFSYRFLYDAIEAARCRGRWGCT